jgi:hypothetical protein
MRSAVVVGAVRSFRQIEPPAPTAVLRPRAALALAGGGFGACGWDVPAVLGGTMIFTCRLLETLVIQRLSTQPRRKVDSANVLLRGF